MLQLAGRCNHDYLHALVGADSHTEYIIVNRLFDWDDGRRLAKDMITYPCIVCGGGDRCGRFRTCVKWRKWVANIWNNFQQQAEQMQSVAQEKAGEADDF